MKQLMLDIEFETVSVPEKRKPSILLCVYCREGKPCYEFLPMRNCYEKTIDIYQGNWQSSCEECYKNRNTDGYLDDILYYEKMLGQVRELKFKLKEHNRNIKKAIEFQLEFHANEVRKSRAECKREILFEKMLNPKNVISH